MSRKKIHSRPVLSAASPGVEPLGSSVRMARNNNAFVSVLIPLAMMSILMYNADVLKRTGQNIYVYFHPGSSHVLRSNSVYDNAAPMMKKLLTKPGVTKGSKEVTLTEEGTKTVPEKSTPINGVTFEENRVLYKLYKAMQEPDYECVIRIVKYRRRKAEEVLTVPDRFVESDCEGLPCNIEAKYSLNLDDFWDSDVVVLMPGAFESYNWNTLLKARPPGQLWALYSKESPVHEPQLAPPADLFQGNPYNLSMTYRTGSDIDLSYGHFLRDRTTNMKKKGNKTKLIMWMASRCEPLGWERTKFVHAIQEYIPVDIYGKCGPFHCPKYDSDSCLPIMLQYKFYLALENSECAEYITEKCWYNGFGAGMVPIVYGAPKEDYARTAPPNSFIHLSDFRTMQEFVDYINMLDQNDTLYEQFFEWKRQGRVVMGMGFRTALSPPKLCSMVNKLNEISAHPENSWRFRNPNFGKWWFPTCHHQSELLGVKI